MAALLSTGSGGGSTGTGGGLGGLGGFPTSPGNSVWDRGIDSQSLALAQQLLEGKLSDAQATDLLKNNYAVANYISGLAQTYSSRFPADNQPNWLKIAIGAIPTLAAKLGNGIITTPPFNGGSIPGTTGTPSRGTTTSGTGGLGAPGLGSTPNWMQILLAGGSALTGYLDNTTGARTSTSDSTSNNTTAASSSTSRDLSPAQQGLEAPLFGYAQDSMLNPSKLIAPIRQSGINAINRNYSAAPQGIADKLLAYGGSQSGKFGRGQRMLEQSRLGDMSTFEGGIGKMALDQQNQGASLAERLYGFNNGSTTSGATTSSGASSGVNVGAGSAAGGALGGGIQTLITLMYLDKLAKGNG